MDSRKEYEYLKKESALMEFHGKCNTCQIITWVKMFSNYSVYEKCGHRDDWGSTVRKDMIRYKATKYKATKYKTLPRSTGKIAAIPDLSNLKAKSLSAGSSPPRQESSLRKSAIINSTNNNKNSFSKIASNDDKIVVEKEIMTAYNDLLQENRMLKLQQSERLKQQRLEQQRLEQQLRDKQSRDASEKKIIYEATLETTVIKKTTIKSVVETESEQISIENPIIEKSFTDNSIVARDEITVCSSVYDCHDIGTVPNSEGFWFCKKHHALLAPRRAHCNLADDCTGEDLVEISPGLYGCSGHRSQFGLI